MDESKQKTNTGGNRYQKVGSTERTEFGLKPEDAVMLAGPIITRMIAESRGPRIPAGLFQFMAFGETRADQVSNQHLIDALLADGRVAYVGKGEYEIIGDAREVLPGAELISAALEHVITILEHTKRNERPRRSELITLLRVNGHFLLSEEFNLLFDLVDNDPRIEIAANNRYFLTQTDVNARQLGSRGLPKRPE